MKEYDLAIIGAGSAGAAVLDAAVARGYRCLLIDAKHPRGFSSLRNQGWLHSGAIYAASSPSGASDQVEACKKGGILIRQLDRELALHAIRPASGLMVFRDENRMSAAFASIAANGLECELVSRSGLTACAPILGDQPQFVGGIITADTTVDTAKILEALIARSVRLGGTCYLTSRRTVCDLRIERNEFGWRVVDDELVANSKVLIVTAGARTAEISRAIAGRDLKATTDKCLVAAIKEHACEQLIMMRDDEMSFMNIAPFAQGITVNLGGRDMETADPADEHIDDAVLRDMLKLLYEFAPGISRIAKSMGVKYVCHKVRFKPDEQAKTPAAIRHFFFDEIAQDCFVAFPGKFTQSMLMAEALLERLTQRYECSGPNRVGEMTPNPIYEHPGTQPGAFSLV